MGHKPKLYLILLAGLVLLLASSVALAGGCSPNTDKVEWTETTTLEPPFNEIIPGGEDLCCLLYHLEPYTSRNETIYFSDGSITYSRMFANEAAHQIPGEAEGPSIMLSMLIYEYPNEEQAIERIHDERMSDLCNRSDIEYYAKRFQFPLEDIVGYGGTWKEPYRDEVQGEEVIFFRVGRYVGNYRLHMTDPPKIEDGYFLPLDLDYLLETAIKTTIPRLRSFVGEVSKEELEPPFNEIIPNCNDLALAFEGQPLYCAAPVISDENTTQLEDGTIRHQRYCRNVDGSVSYYMSIYVEDNETEAVEVFQRMWGDCPDWAWHCESAYDPMPDDAICFEDSGSDEEGAWAAMEIHFRVGRYICFYSADDLDVSHLSWDNHEESWRLSSTLRLILVEAVQDTISGLRSLEPA